jgi:hypothetical protein
VDADRASEDSREAELIARPGDPSSQGNAGELSWEFMRRMPTLRDELLRPDTPANRLIDSLFADGTMALTAEGTVELRLDPAQRRSAGIDPPEVRQRPGGAELTSLITSGHARGLTQAGSPPPTARMCGQCGVIWPKRVSPPGAVPFPATNSKKPSGYATAGCHSGRWASGMARCPHDGRPARRGPVVRRHSAALERNSASAAQECSLARRHVA